MALKRLTDRINKKLNLKEGDRGCFVEVVDKKSPRLYRVSLETRLEDGELVNAAFNIGGQLSHKEQTVVVRGVLDQLEDLEPKPLPTEA